jgi:hypothetical protein
MTTIGVEGVRYYDQYRANNSARLDDGTTVGPPIPYGAGGWVDLDYVYNVTNGFHDSMTASGVGGFYYAGTDVWEIQIKDTSFGGDDEHNADAVDLWFFVGHSHIQLTSGQGAQIVFNSDKNAWYSNSHTWRLGNNWNLDWAALYTCESLIFRDALWENYHDIFDRLHILLGCWAHPNLGPDQANLGRAFAENLLDGSPVSAAWFNALGVANCPAALSAEGEETWHEGQPDYTATTLTNDHFWGRGEVRPDRPADAIAWLHYRWVHPA